jgi:hypothetical protein
VSVTANSVGDSKGDGRNHHRFLRFMHPRHLLLLHQQHQHLLEINWVLPRRFKSCSPRYVGICSLSMQQFLGLDER